MSEAQIAFMERVDGLLETRAPDDAREALRLLDTVPEPERGYLEIAALFERIAFHVLDRHDDAFRALFHNLVRADDDQRWLDQGQSIKAWIQGKRGTPEQDTIAATLREVCDRVSFAVPRLLLTWLLLPGPIGSELVERCQEAVQPERWKARPDALRAWLHGIALAFYVVVADRSDRGLAEEARRYAALIPAYPWRRANPFAALDFGRLALSLHRTGLHRELGRFAAAFRDRKDWGGPRYWLGQVAQLAGQYEVAAGHFQAAIGKPDVGDAEHGAMAHLFYDEGRSADARRCCDQIRDREAPGFLMADAMCLAMEERWPEALVQWDALLGHRPGDPVLRFERLHALRELNREAEYESELRQFAGGEGSWYAGCARAYLAELLVRSDRATEALEVLGPHLDESLGGVEDPELQVGLCTVIADTLAALHDDAAALGWYDRALALEPTDDLRLSCAGTLVRLGSYDRAEKLLGQVRAAGSTSAELGFLQLLVDDHFDRWSAVVEGFDRVGLAWLREEKKLREGLGAAIRAWLELDRPDRAQALCEAALEEMLADEHLRDLRATVIRRMTARFEELRSGLEGERQRRAEEQQQSDRLRQQVERQRERELVVHRRAEAQRRQLSSLRAQAREAPAPVHPPALPAHLAGLRPEAAAQLRSALLIHAQLAAHPDADHGPVVVQLARVLEGEVNRVLVDRLVGLHLKQGGALDDFPGPAHCSVVARGNRWSLGEAAELLTTRLERPEPDGSVTLVRNPRSDERHERLLAAGFDRVPEAIRTGLPLHLREVARLRNRAGHAGAPLARQEAEHLRGLVLGDRAGEGLLAGLLALEAR
jgi:tetratricopeptide (TPR) repeat protein